MIHLDTPCCFQADLSEHQTVVLFFQKWYSTKFQTTTLCIETKSHSCAILVPAIDHKYQCRYSYALLLQCIICCIKVPIEKSHNYAKNSQHTKSLSVTLNIEMKSTVLILVHIIVEILTQAMMCILIRHTKLQKNAYSKMKYHLPILLLFPYISRLAHV